MNKILLLTLTVFALGLGTALAGEKPKLIAAKFHKDTCGSCKAMAPALSNLQDKYGDKDVLFVTFDQSTPATQNQAALLASSLGVYEVYETTEGTGFVLLIDADSMKVLEKMKGMTADQMGEKLTASLAAN